uniref:scavenger receptor cysteine-rich domain-containing group B protein-like isoform X1 n=1 Tax=Myxine glutinosa TaxID=7769 RepID=UPI00358E7BF7
MTQLMFFFAMFFTPAKSHSGLCPPHGVGRVTMFIWGTGSHVRLVGTHDPCQGRVEVWHKGVWGSVCDDDWDLRDAQVLCQSLNCKDAILATRRASFGPGHGPVHLDNVRCSGDETNLLVCPHNGWGIHNCGHHEDAGAICSGALHITTAATSTFLSKLPRDYRTQASYTQQYKRYA